MGSVSPLRGIGRFSIAEDWAEAGLLMTVSAAQPAASFSRLRLAALCGLGSGFGMNFSAGHPFRISGPGSTTPSALHPPLFDQGGVCLEISLLPEEGWSRSDRGGGVDSRFTNNDSRLA